MTNAMRIHTARLKEETQGFCDIINPFDIPPTGRGLLRVDGDPFDFAQGHGEEDRTVNDIRTT